MADPALRHQEERQRAVGVGHHRSRIELFHRDQTSLSPGPVTRQNAITVPPARDHAARRALGHTQIVLNLSRSQMSTPVQHCFGVPACYLSNEHKSVISYPAIVAYIETDFICIFLHFVEGQHRE